MAKILITGSADGLGQLSARALIKMGHDVVLHARNEERCRQALANAPGAHAVLSGDLSSMEETKALAQKANALSTFDAVIHNAGVYHVAKDNRGPEGLPLLFAVNSIAPYILTCLMNRPRRLIYLSSGLHLQGNPSLPGIAGANNTFSRRFSYDDTKLHDLILAMAVARRWEGVYANAVDPGWMPTKMGGAAAPGNLDQGIETQVWLAVSNDPQACTSGHYYHYKKQRNFLPAAADPEVQDKFLAFCEQVSGIRLPD